MPIANNPTGETHAASLDKVYSIGVWSILNFNNKNNRPIIIERINGFKIFLSGLPGLLKLYIVIGLIKVDDDDYSFLKEMN